MEILETIDIAGGRRIDLCQGDLSRLARSVWFDAVVVSAFDSDYTPTPTSLIGALATKGVSVAQLASRKEVDYTVLSGTWLSEPVTASDPGIGFGRVLCFEPQRLGRPPRVMSQLFTALVPIVAERPEIRSIAMPVLGSGNMGYALEEMLTPILDSAIDALRHGLPIDRIAIVVRTAQDAIVARKVFQAARVTVAHFDVFLSYSHVDAPACDVFVRALRDRRPGTTVFVDQSEIGHGVAWQRRIFESLDRCRRIISLITPTYLGSDICLEEFHIAWMRSRQSKQAILRPLFVSGSELPTYIQALQYLDCREADTEKLAHAAASVADGL